MVFILMQFNGFGEVLVHERITSSVVNWWYSRMLGAV